MSFQVAIDGPVASGKGTVARLVADRLGFLYVDTGAMYRMVALWSLDRGVDLGDEAAVLQSIGPVSLELRRPSEDEQDGRLITAVLNGQDVSWAIRTEKVSAGASKVATLAGVRAFLVAKQQQIASTQDVVMEGRDITFRVLPMAQLKIYLTASPKVRAKRRQLDLQQQGKDVSYEEIYQELIKRDIQDSGRAADPLQVTPDAWVLDTTELTIEQVVEHIVREAHQRGAARMA